MGALSQRSDAPLPGPALPDPVVRRLWTRMAEVYGQRWTSAYGADATTGAGATWAKGLAGITPMQIRAGIVAAMAGADPWPPSLPQFRALCLGIPEFASVLCELRTRNAKRTPFARLVWGNVDSWRLGQASAQDADRMLREAYGLAREHVMRGGALPPVLVEVAAEPSPPPKPASPETAAKAMADIAEILKPKEDPTDEQSEPGGSAGAVAAMGSDAQEVEPSA
jgi:hypothetical protein